MGGDRHLWKKAKGSPEDHRGPFRLSPSRGPTKTVTARARARERLPERETEAQEDNLTFCVRQAAAVGHKRGRQCPPPIIRGDLLTQPFFSIAAAPTTTITTHTESRRVSWDPARGLWQRGCPRQRRLSLRLRSKTVMNRLPQQLCHWDGRALTPSCRLYMDERLREGREREPLQRRRWRRIVTIGVDARSPPDCLYSDPRL
mmetsp:Transcript_49741/g.98018  ORF Transcript_49741/g.98018 Transcript_49741/m.98018 type:complete len:202 (+) Transcript_49741:322-927(+)